LGNGGVTQHSQLSFEDQAPFGVRGKANERQIKSTTPARAKQKSHLSGMEGIGRNLARHVLPTL